MTTQAAPAFVEQRANLQSAAVHFQLLLDSFLLVSRTTAALRILLHQAVDMPYGLRLLTGHWELLERQITAFMRPLAIYPDQSQEQALAVLRNDCFQLTQCLPKEPAALQLAALCQQAWNHGHQTAYLLASGVGNSYADRCSLLHAAEQLCTSVSIVSAIWPQAAYAVKDDENFLYFLLAHRREFEALQSGQTVVDLLKRWYPEGIHTLSQHLIVRYTARDFHDLLPSIEALLAKVPNW